MKRYLLLGLLIISGCTGQSQSLQSCVIEEEFYFDSFSNILRSRTTTINNVISVLKTNEYVIIRYVFFGPANTSSRGEVKEMFIDLTTTLETRSSRVSNVICE